MPGPFDSLTVPQLTADLREHDYIAERGLATAEEFAAIWAETEADIEDGIEFARTSPDPDPADILDDVYTA